MISRTPATRWCLSRHCAAAARRQTAHSRHLLLPGLGGPDDADYTGELLPYITGEKKAPVPTYFIGGWGHGSKQALEALAGAHRSRCIANSCGLAVVCLVPRLTRFCNQKHWT